MTKEDAIKELKALKADYWDDDGYGRETIQYYDTMLALNMAIEALEQEPCDKCVYSTSEGCQYDDITETIPPFETSDDAISRQAVKDLMRSLTRWYVRSEDGKFNNVGLLYDDVMFGIDRLPPVNPQKPICPSAGIDCEDCPAYEKKSEWQHDHEILKAYSDGANNMLDKIRNEVCDIDDEIVLNPDSFYERKVYVRFYKVIDIIDKYKAESEG